MIMMTRHQQLTALQVQEERTAGQLLSIIAHEQSPSERSRKLSLAFWHAGRASALEDQATAEDEQARGTPRGSSRS
jgi:hypothetical protein